jgi:hypothetical protein
MASWFYFFWYCNIQVTNQNTNIETSTEINFLFNKINWSENDFIKKLFDCEF